MQMEVIPDYSFFPGSPPIVLVVKYRLVSMRP
jgi:hypothetical protein